MAAEKVQVASISNQSFLSQFKKQAKIEPDNSDMSDPFAQTGKQKIQEAKKHSKNCIKIYFKLTFRN